MTAASFSLLPRVSKGVLVRRQHASSLCLLRLLRLLRLGIQHHCHVLTTLTANFADMAILLLLLIIVIKTQSYEDDLQWWQYMKGSSSDVWSQHSQGCVLTVMLVVDHHSSGNDTTSGTRTAPRLICLYTKAQTCTVNPTLFRLSFFLFLGGLRCPGGGKQCACDPEGVRVVGLQGMLLGLIFGSCWNSS